MQLLWDAWRVALPQPMFERAWEWVSMGEDSLLTVGDRDQDEDAPTSRITFWLYLSVEWPSELADHWVSLALVDRRAQLDAELAECGYRIRPGSEYPELGDDRHRFIVDGERIGYASDQGMYWALPEYDFQANHQLSPAEQERARASLGDVPCECPYCVRLAASRPKSA
jgi:hypothetical protein